jgi:HlyD family secretion protein
VRQLALFFLPLIGCDDPPTVHLAQAATGTVEHTISSVNSGTVRAERDAVLAFGTVGRVKAVHRSLGDTVREGEVIAELENEDLVAAFETAKSEHERVESLVRARTIASYEREGARRMLELSRANLEKSLIRAPFEGIITELNLEAGELSQITTPDPRAKVRLVDLRPRYIEAEIDEVDLRFVQVGAEARVEVLATRAEAFNARVRRVIPFVSTLREQDRTAQVELELEHGAPLLPPGASADVEIVAARRVGVTTVPTRAVLGRAGSRYVFRFDSGVARKAPVEVGLGNYERTEVISGITEGARLVLPSESIELEDGLAVAPAS